MFSVRWWDSINEFAEEEEGWHTLPSPVPTISLFLVPGCAMPPALCPLTMPCTPLTLVERFFNILLLMNVYTGLKAVYRKRTYRENVLKTFSFL